MTIDAAYGEARDAIAELRRNLAIVTQERDALRQENESLRAQCGLRQIQGYHEGEQRAEADNEALRALQAENDAGIARLAAVSEDYRQRAERAEADNAKLREQNGNLLIERDALREQVAAQKELNTRVWRENGILAAKAEKAEDDNAALRQDAERWRYHRDPERNNSGIYPCAEDEAVWLEQLDAAIDDAARREG